MIRRFTKAQRSTFHYWYYHWACFNLLAKKLGVWKFKFLFHDIEKPFLKLFLPYPKVKKWHRVMSVETGRVYEIMFAEEFLASEE